MCRGSTVAPKDTPSKVLHFLTHRAKREIEWGREEGSARAKFRGKINGRSQSLSGKELTHNLSSRTDETHRSQASAKENDLEQRDKEGGKMHNLSTIAKKKRGKLSPWTKILLY